MSKVSAAEQQETQERQLAIWEKVRDSAFSSARTDVIEQADIAIRSIKATIETLKFLQRPDVVISRRVP